MCVCYFRCAMLNSLMFNLFCTHAIHAHGVFCYPCWLVCSCCFFCRVGQACFACLFDSGLIGSRVYPCLLSLHGCFKTSVRVDHTTLALIRRRDFDDLDGFGITCTLYGWRSASCVVENSGNNFISHCQLVSIWQCPHEPLAFLDMLIMLNYSKRAPTSVSHTTQRPNPAM